MSAPFEQIRALLFNAKAHTPFEVPVELSIDTKLGLAFKCTSGRVEHQVVIFSCLNRAFAFARNPVSVVAEWAELFALAVIRVEVETARAFVVDAVAAAGSWVPVSVQAALVPEACAAACFGVQVVTGRARLRQTGALAGHLVILPANCTVTWVEVSTLTSF